VSELAVATLLMLAVATIANELHRFRVLTPLALLTVGHVLYIGFNPLVFLISPSKASYFVHLVSLGAEVHTSGIASLMLSANLFQLGCLGVSLYTAHRANELGRIPPVVHADEKLVNALFQLGLANVAFGFIGVIAIGIEYNGSPIGLYELGYGRRTEFLYTRSIEAFLLDLLQYGSVILIVAGVLARKRAALIVLVAMILHGTMMKSKFPVFYVSCAFGMATMLSGQLRTARSWMPLVAAGVVIASLSFARSAKEQNLVGMLERVQDNQQEWWESIGQPWNNDFPGAAAASYMVVNDPEPSLDPAPLREAFMVFVPRFIFDRGPSQADQFASHLYGGAYYPGAGMSWSLICDGYRLFGHLGVLAVGAIVAGLAARLAQDLKSFKASARQRAIVLVCITTPVFLVVPRTGFAGVFKLLAIVLTVSYLPVRWLGYDPSAAEAEAPTRGASKT
jgi:hypothetical protein